MTGWDVDIGVGVEADGADKEERQSENSVMNCCLCGLRLNGNMI